jgi:hypothetical protein
VQIAATRRPPWWVLFAILIVTATYIGQNGKRDFWDFEVYRAASVRVLAAEPLYRDTDGHYQFKYWPAFALAMAPFAAIPLAAGKTVWYLISVALLLVFIGQSARILPERRLRETLVAGLTLLFMGKFIVKELVNGQTNLLLGVLVIYALIAAQRGKARMAAVLIGLAVFVKPYALILLPWVWLILGWTALLDALAVILVGLLLPAVLYGWRGNLDLLVEWYRTVSATTAPNLLVAENISAASTWAKWLGPGPAASWLGTATSLVLLGLGALLVFFRRRVEGPAYLEIGTLMLLVPLVSPQGWDYVLLLAVPAFACLLDRWRDLSRPWRVVAGVSLGVISFTIYDLVGRALYLRLMAMSVVSLAAVGVLLCLLHLRWRRLA